MEDLLTSGETSNYQLISAAQKLGIPLRRVAFKDQLTRHPPEEGAYIINMQDSSDGQGTHWVGLFLTSGKYKAHALTAAKKQPLAYYFDSYGQAPPEAVLRYAKEYRAEWLWYSNEQIQGLNTNYCGSYVMNWLYAMSRKKGTPEARYEAFLEKFRVIRRF